MTDPGTEERRLVRRTTRRWLIGSLAAVVLLGGAVVGFFWISGTPLLMDEWHCSDGEAPYVFTEGGSACAAVDATLPDGASWDPLGNRPFDCGRRWGWQEIWSDNGEESDCLHQGLPVPTGWTLTQP